MSDPAAMEGMMGMMKGNMAMMVPQTLIMGWINAFFSGFVVCMLELFLDLFPATLPDPYLMELNTPYHPESRHAEADANIVWQ